MVNADIERLRQLAQQIALPLSINEKLEVRDADGKLLVHHGGNPDWQRAQMFGQYLVAACNAVPGLLVTMAKLYVALEFAHRALTEGMTDVPPGKRDRRCAECKRC